MPKPEAKELSANMEICGIWGIALKQEQSVIVNDPASHPERVGVPKGHVPLTSFLAVPLKETGRTFGLLALANKEGGYTEADREDMEALSAAFAEALQRRRVEKALEESEVRFRSAFETAAAGMALVSLEGRWLQVNRSLCEMVGYSEKELLNLTFQDITHPDDLDRDLAYVKRLLAGEIPFYHMEKRYCHKQGGIVWILLGVSLVRDKAGEPLYFVSQIQDVTERKRTEAELRKLAIVAEQAAEMIVLTDANGTIEYVNPAFEQVTGYTREEAIGQNPRILKSGKHHEDFYRGLWETITAGGTWRGRFTNKKKDGTLYEERAVISPIHGDEAGAIVGFVAVNEDITEESRLEAQLRQSQKMEAIGRLAGGVAHDFNNVLQAIVGYAYAIRQDLSPDDGHYEDLSEILGAADRAAGLTRQLLAFSRRQVLQKRDLDLNELLGNLMKMLGRVLGEDIQLDLVQGHRLGTVHADPGQMEQVLMNLCVNARDAMPQGGRIAIETENVVINGEYVKLHPWARQGRYMLLSVADTGEGIPQDVQEHIFEPFFTTKGEGEGTGLGLATIYGIVKQHDGYIHVYSEVGSGTTFKVYLPVVERRAVHTGTKIERVVIGGSETILLAEDDEKVRRMTTRLLEGAGYKVVAVSDGDEAVSVFGKEQERIDLVVSDVIMPGLGGRALYEKLKAIKADTPVLFCSGYSSGKFDSEFFETENIQLLQKPYGPDDLLRWVRKLLDKE